MVYNKFMLCKLYFKITKLVNYDNIISSNIIYLFYLHYITP